MAEAAVAAHTTVVGVEVAPMAEAAVVVDTPRPAEAVADIAKKA
jgi:hypothetical protein